VRRDHFHEAGVYAIPAEEEDPDDPATDPRPARDAGES
jgi:hypothetical protein